MHCHISSHDPISHVVRSARGQQIGQNFLKTNVMTEVNISPKWTRVVRRMENTDIYIYGYIWWRPFSVHNLFIWTATSSSITYYVNVRVLTSFVWGIRFLEISFRKTRTSRIFVRRTLSDNTIITRVSDSESTRLTYTWWTERSICRSIVRLSDRGRRPTATQDVWRTSRIWWDGKAKSCRRASDPCPIWTDAPALDNVTLPESGFIAIQFDIGIPE